MSPLELGAVAAIISALAGALVALRRFKPEKDSLVVTQAQGAATILDDLVKTLYAEIDRLRTELRETRDELARCRGGSG